MTDQSSAGKTNFTQTLAADAKTASKWLQARHYVAGFIIGAIVGQIVALIWGF